MRPTRKLKHEDARPPEPQPDPTGTETVLVVEDDPSVRQAIRKGLERFGYTVLEAPNGDAALSISRHTSSPPDVVLADMIMPGMSGADLVKTLQHETGGRAPRVLMMSGYSADVVQRRATPDDACPLIHKPFGPRELATRMREILDGTRA
jgi:two-component system, cell cycle sensor histidine kinase and response regulator CckA